MTRATSNKYVGIFLQEYWCHRVLLSYHGACVIYAQTCTIIPWYFICFKWHFNCFKKFLSLACILFFSQRNPKKMFRHYFRVLNIKYSHWNKVHLLYTSIISSIMASTEWIAFTVVNKEAVTVWLKCCINYQKSFCFGTCVWCRNFAIGEIVFKELCKMIFSCNGQVVLNNKVCDHNFPI